MFFAFLILCNLIQLQKGNIMKEQLPLLDNFYKESPFLSADLLFQKSLLEINEKTKGNKILTAVFTWSRPERLDFIKNKCEFIDDDISWKGYIFDNKTFIYLLDVGSPIAAACVEKLKTYGVKNFLCFGTAGHIGCEVEDDTVVVVDKAIRDEGTSCHYMPASLYVDLNTNFSDKLLSFLKSKKIKCQKGTTWTTDAIFRETPGRIAKRIKQGAVCVEMECAAIAAVTNFYKLNFCQFLFFSDKINLKVWDQIGTREERISTREKLLLLALEFAEKL